MDTKSKLIVVSGFIITALVIENQHMKREIRKTNERVTNANSFLKIVKRLVPELIDQVPDKVNISRQLSDDMTAFMIFNENDL